MSRKTYFELARRNLLTELYWNMGQDYPCIEINVLFICRGANKLFRENLLAPLREMHFDETEFCIIQVLVLFTPGK